MTVTIDHIGTKVTVNDGRIESDSTTLTRALRKVCRHYMTTPAYKAAYKGDADVILAEFIVGKIGGEITQYDRDELPPLADA